MRVVGSYIRNGPVLPALLVSAVVVLAAVRFAPLRKSAEPAVYETGSAVLPPGPVANVAIGASKDASAHHVRVAEEVKPHLHRRHDETVVILAGRGRLTLAARTLDVGPGSVVIVPRGTVHSLVVSGDPLEAVSVFAPPFDGQDRVFVDE
jgi:mannose-6-phosphate isomerase-like protein (cupin superfamily)